MGLPRPAYSSYLTIAWPSPSSFKELAAPIAGCSDFLELGLPARNPLYDGPTIRRTHREALAAAEGMDRRALLRLAAESAGDTPFTVMTYLWEHGGAKGLRGLVEDVAAAGAAGLLLPDLLFEHPGLLGEYVDAVRGAGMRPAFFVSSKFPHRLLSRLASLDPLFIYLGLQPATGAGLPVAVLDNVALARRLAGSAYLLAGFSVRGPGDAVGLVGAGADAVVIGSELVRRALSGGPAAAASLACEVRRAVRGAAGGGG